MNVSLNNIVFLNSPSETLELPLVKDTLLLGRPDEEEGVRPDVDFTPDFHVSRRHARLSRREGVWWIEDLRSTGGTRVDGEEIQGFENPVKLLPGVHVQMGKTVWMIAPVNFHQLRWKDLTVSFTCIGSINYALYHCGIPIISDLAIRNSGDHRCSPFTITISIPGYSDLWRRECASLNPGEEITEGKVPLSLKYEMLEGNEVRRAAQLRVAIDRATVFEKGIDVLGFFEWPTDPAFRKTLACFVQPSNPIIQEIILDAAPGLRGECDPPSFTHLLKTGAPDAASKALETIYTSIVQKYAIRYVHEAPSFGDDSQNLRPPQKVILDPEKGVGQGTCIDLSLLLASCLENIHLQPLILFVREKGSFQHAFVGCWSDITARFEPVLLDQESLKSSLDKGQLLVIEVTGLTDRWRKQLSFIEAGEIAKAQLSEGDFLFGVDIAAARQTIVPLQFPMSPGLIGIIREAEALAREEGGGRLETRHLLAALLQDDDRSIWNVLGLAGAELGKLGRTAQKHREDHVRGRTPLPTMNYRRALEDARLIASDVGMAFVEKEHLFYALLISRSEGMSSVLEIIGTNRVKAKLSFESNCSWIKKVVRTELFEDLHEGDDDH